MAGGAKRDGAADRGLHPSIRGAALAPIYDDVIRNETHPAHNGEGSFQFLNRVAGEYWQQVRDLVQRWAEQLPTADAYKDLRGRLRADDHESHSAFLELYLHESLRRAGYELTIHPTVPSGRRRPDLLAIKGETNFFLEATMPGAAPSARAAANRRAAFLATIDRGQNRDFFLALERLTVGPRPGKGAEARKKIDAWLSCLPLDVAYGSREDRERFHWAEDGWEVEFSAIPISPEHRGRPDHRPIGVYADGEAGIINDAPAFQAALASKVNAYGQLDRPLVLAVGTFIWDRDRWHSSNALYGHEAVHWWENADGTYEHQLGRRNDGFFGAPPDWKNRQVAAVLHVNQLQPYHFQRAEVTLWHHPSALQPLLDVDLGIPAQIVHLTGSELSEVSSSARPNDHFGVHEQWPEGEPYPDES